MYQSVKKLISYKKAFWMFFLLCFSPLSAAQTAPTLQIEITGLPKEVLANAQARLNVNKKAIEKNLNAYSIRQFYKNAPDEIKNAITPYGYFKPIIESHLINAAHTERWIMQFNINPGPTVKIAHVDLTVTGPGKDDVPIKNLVEHFPLAAGQQLNTELYQKAKQALFNTANKHGYFDATITKSKILINESSFQANIVIQFETGPRYYFGPTRFIKTGPFSLAFLNRFIPYKEGDPYNADLIQKLQGDLND